jgi:tetrahydromethanopterin S-methyltransferase subunit B
MPTLQEARSKLDEQIELLRRLQRDKTMAAVEQQEAIQKQIDESQKQIRELDSTVQQLMQAPKSTSRTIY